MVKMGVYANLISSSLGWVVVSHSVVGKDNLGRFECVRSRNCGIIGILEVRSGEFMNVSELIRSANQLKREGKLDEVIA